MSDRSKYANFLTWSVLTIGLLALILTSFYVAQKSAIIHNNNNDQLIDSYMFEDAETFNNAIFPSAHTFLLKWPIFAISSLFGNTTSTYVILTILVYIITVLGFIYVIYRLSKKDLLVTGFSALCLSSILLLVPAQPFNASLLPVNMGMITTRNLEFLVLFLYIYLIVKSVKINSLPFYLSILTLGLLGATDKFFLMLVLVGAVYYILYKIVFLKNKINFTLFIPLLSAIVASVFATGLLLLIHKLEITNIPSATNAAPFALVSSVWQMTEALAGAIQGIIVNYGAGFFNRSAKLSLAPYLINGMLLIAAAYAIYKLFFVKVVARKYQQESRWNFILWLVLTLFAAITVFIASNHGYVYDGRYLTGSLFAGIAAIAYLISAYSFKKKRILLISASVILMFTLPLTLYVARANYIQSINDNHKELGQRTEQASNIVVREDADILVGDYWFVTPTKLKTAKQVTVVPMTTEACDQPNYFLTSTKWYQPSGNVDKSAYYILRDAGENSETFNHGCTLEFLNQKYGKPEKEFVIRGTKEKPIDIIRIYPYDVRTKFQ